MLLSLFISFLLARIFPRKICVLFMAFCLLLISFFSVGVPSYHEFPYRSEPRQQGILFENPLPLSFPFYASLTLENIGISTGTQYYQLHFLTLIFHRDWVQGTSPGMIWLNISWSDYILYCSFFILVNIVGAVLGYWLSKQHFIEKLLKKRTNQ